jgi:hypothetical protein
LQLKLPRSVDQGALISYSFSTQNVYQRDRLVIERQEGTAHTYRVVAVLSHKGSGRGTLKGLALGRYTLRIADIRTRRITFGATPEKVAVYGNVSLATLIGDRSGGTYTSPTQTFPYVDHFKANAVTGDTVLTVSGADNNCRAIGFSFIPEDTLYTFDPEGNPFTLTVVQQSLDPVSAGALPNQVQSLNVQLVPGQSWSLRTSVVTSSDSDQLDVTGLASCDSVAPVAQ